MPSLRGKTVDITNSLTDQIMLKAVPKQMLIHFGGFHNISKYLRTNPDDNTKQVLRLPGQYVEHVGLKIVVNWMQRACKEPRNTLKLNAPGKNIFIACAIARALRTLGCSADAHRVHKFIKRCYFSGPLNAKKVMALWGNLPHDCIYNRWAVVNVRNTLEGNHDGTLPESFKINLRKLMNQWQGITVAVAAVQANVNKNRATYHEWDNYGKDKITVEAWVDAVEDEEIETVNGELAPKVKAMTIEGIS